MFTDNNILNGFIIIGIIFVAYIVLRIILVIADCIVDSKYLNARRNIYTFALYLYYYTKLSLPYQDIVEYTYKGQLAYMNIIPEDIGNCKLEGGLKFIQFVDDDNYSLYVFSDMNKNLDWINDESQIKVSDLLFSVSNNGDISSINIGGIDESVGHIGDEYNVYRGLALGISKTLNKLYKDKFSMFIYDLNQSK